jgi:hypothetical protein
MKSRLPSAQVRCEVVGFSPTGRHAGDCQDYDAMKNQPEQLQCASGHTIVSKRPVFELLLKAVQYVWAFPVTFLGLIAAALTALTGGSVKLVSGVVEAGGGFAEWIMRTLFRGKASCMTIGHVIIGFDPDNLARARAHERVHVTQYEKWGALFIPLYIASSLWAWSRGKHRYRDNVFEREAYAKAPVI